MCLPCPLLTGAKALDSETPWATEPRTLHFLAALAVLIVQPAGPRLDAATDSSPNATSD
jgi:hypothetical protein